MSMAQNSHGAAATGCPISPVASPQNLDHGGSDVDSSPLASHSSTAHLVSSFGHGVQVKLRHRFRNLQGTITTHIRNLQDNVANLRNTSFVGQGTGRQWAYHYDQRVGLYRIRSLRKLLDVVEQEHSYLSIILLLLNVGLEAAAFGIFLRVQQDHVPKEFLNFDWGVGYFTAEVVLSAIFMLGWVGFLSVEPKKLAYTFHVKSIMNHLSSGWVLLLALGATLTGSRRWTRVYAPMFLRVWSLHESLLTLLNYPQISAFFTVNRLEMARSIIQCLAVLGVSVGTLQAVESFYGDPMEYFEAAYMMLQTFSTIGFGDVHPITVQGRLLLIVFIGIGIGYFVPLLQYIADVGVRQLIYAHYTTWFKRTDHIVICGDLQYNDLQAQLKNLFAAKRHYLSMSVVVMVTKQPPAQVLLLLNSPVYRSSVHLLVGDPAKTADLDRCNARGASALFLYGSGTNSTYYSDYTVAQQAMVAHNHVPHIPLHVLLHRSRYTRSLMPRTAKVLEFERLNHILLGLGCVLPGVIPLVGNLMRTFDPVTAEALWRLDDMKGLVGLHGKRATLRALRKVWARRREMLTYDTVNIRSKNGANDDNDGASGGDVTQSSWKEIYEASLGQHVAVLTAPPLVRQHTLLSLAHLLYRGGLCPLGVVQQCQGQEPIVELAPRGVLCDAVKVIVICDAQRHAQRALEEALMLSAADSLTSPGPCVPVTATAPGKRRAFMTCPPLTKSTAYPVRYHAAEDVVVEVPRPSAAAVAALDDDDMEMQVLLDARCPVAAPPPVLNPTEAAAQLPLSRPSVKTPSQLQESSRFSEDNAVHPSEDSSHSSTTVMSTATLGQPKTSTCLQVRHDVRHLHQHYVFIDLSSAHERTNWSREAAVESRTAKAADYFDAMRPVRQHNPDSSIVLLADEPNYDYLSSLWEDEHAGSLILVKGCALFLSDLRRCNVAEAAAVVIFSAGDRCDEHGDSLSLLASQLVRQLVSEERGTQFADIPIVVEVDHPELVSLFSPAPFTALSSSTQMSDADYVAEPSFASGCVVCRHMLDTSLQEMYFIPEMQGVLEQLLTGRDNALSIAVLDTSEHWRVYGDVIEDGLSRRLLPMAIHRFHEIITDNGAIPFRFIVTNPPLSFPMLSTDYVYCLKA